MPFYSFDLISPKITLNYKGNNSHVSRIGGFLSLCLIIILCTLIVYCFIGLLGKKYYTSCIYEENINQGKIFQTLDYTGINHFIRIFSHTNDEHFGNINNKNIIIYGIKENKYNIYNNKLNSELSNIEHWLYDKCDNIVGIDLSFFNAISNVAQNYSSFICMRFYYNPSVKRYYEIGQEGYIKPTIETNDINKKKYSYKIIIQRCINDTLISNKFGYICNSENEINKYLDIYNEIFIYFSNNNIMPLKLHKQFEQYFYSISSTIQKIYFFETNIIFEPTKITTKNGRLIGFNKDIFSYILNYFYINNVNNEGDPNLLGIFNLYLNNKILIYQIIYSNFLDVLSHLGGIVKILFFLFEMLNYLNHRYTVLENTKELFKINSGMDSTFCNVKEINLENMRHVSTKNNKMQIQMTHDENKKIISPKITKNRLRLDPKGLSPKVRLSFKKNNLSLYPNVASNKKNRLSKRNTNTFNVKNDKRKSTLSQGYRVKSKDNKENTIYIKNKSYWDNEEGSNNKVPSSNYYANDNNSNFFNSKDINLKLETSKKNNNELNPFNSNKKYLKLNLKLNSNKHTLEKEEKTSHLILKTQNRDNNLSRKSINNNEKKLFRNSVFSKNHFVQKNSTELINDSSKQILVNNKNLLITINNNKTQYDKNKVDEFNFINRTNIINNNTDLVNSTKNLNTLSNNNGNIDANVFLRTIIKNKLKYEIPETKDGINGSYIGKKIKHQEFFKSMFMCKQKIDNKIRLISSFRLKLLSEEHLYRNHINLYLIQKIFQIEDSYKFDIKELYNNL